MVDSESISGAFPYGSRSKGMVVVLCTIIHTVLMHWRVFGSGEGWNELHRRICVHMQGKVCPASFGRGTGEEKKMTTFGGECSGISVRRAATILCLGRLILHWAGQREQRAVRYRYGVAHCKME